ncbi:MAG: hypothetical protein ABJZ55_22200, partial [Fuerstiella sp.]
MSALTPPAQLLAAAAKVRFLPILWKNDVLLAQKVASKSRRKHLSYQAVRICCGAGKILANLRRFWAVAASKNSS